MTRLVVDASVAVKWLVEEEHSAAAKRLIAGPYELHAPRLLASEVVNALWRKGARHALKRSAGALPALSSRPLPKCRYGGARTKQVSAEATRLALALDRPVYDCVYLALAQRIRGRVVTADGRFARALAPTEHGGTVVMLTDLVQVA